MAESGGPGAEPLISTAGPYGSPTAPSSKHTQKAGGDQALSLAYPRSRDEAFQTPPHPRSWQRSAPSPCTRVATRTWVGRLISGRSGTYEGGYNHCPTIDTRIPKSYKNEIYVSLICWFKPLKRWVSVLKQGKQGTEKTLPFSHCCRKPISMTLSSENPRSRGVRGPGNGAVGENTDGSPAAMGPTCQPGHRTQARTSAQIHSRSGSKKNHKNV